MSIVQRIKEATGLDDPGEYTYRCRECGHEFESDLERESQWISCPECGHDEFETVE